MKYLLCTLSMIAVFASCNPPANTIGNDQVMKNKATVQKFFDELYNKHNTSIFDSLVTADFVEHEIDPGFEPTRDGAKKDYANLFKIFPDLTGKVNFLIVDSDKIAVNGSFAATQSGEMMGKAPSNKKFNVDGIDAYRFNKEGKIVEHWGYYEERKMMIQLGEIPDPAAKADTTKTTTTVTTDTKEVQKEVTKIIKK